MVAYTRSQARKVASNIVGEGVEVYEEEEASFWDDRLIDWDEYEYWHDFDLDDLPEDVSVSF